MKRALTLLFAALLVYLVLWPAAVSRAIDDEAFVDLLRSAQRYVQEQQPRRAVDLLRPHYQKLRTTSDWRTPYLASQLADALALSGEVKSADAILSNTLERIHPQAPVALRRQLKFRAAEVKLLLGETDRARSLFEEVRGLLAGADDPLALPTKQRLDQIKQSAGMLASQEQSDIAAIVDQVFRFELVGRTAAAEQAADSVPDPAAHQKIAIQVSERILPYSPERTIRWLNKVDIEGLPFPSRIARLETMGVAHLDLQRFAVAAEWFEKIVTLSKQERDPETEVRGLRHLAGALMRAGDLETGVTAIERAMELDSKANPLVTMNILVQFAEGLRLTGKLGQARLRLAEARQIAEGITVKSEEIMRALAAAESQTGNILRLLNDPIGAEAAYKRSLQQLDALGGHKNSYRADRDVVLGNLVQVLIIQGRRPDAADLLNEIVKRNEGNVFSGTYALLTLGELQRATQPGEARSTTLRALALAKQSGHPSLILSAHHNLALLDIDTGNWAGARDHLSQAISHLPNDPDPVSDFDVHRVAGRVSLELGKRSEALAYLAKALRAHEKLRSRSGEDSALQKVQERGLETYELAISLALQLGRIELAWTFAERARSRVLIDRLVSTRAANGRAVPAAERIAWGQAENALERMRHAAANKEQFEHLRQAYVSALENHRRLIEERWKSCSTCLDYRAMQPQELSSVQEALGAHLTIVSYFQLPTELVAFVVSAEDILARVIPISEAELRSSIDAILRFDSDFVPPDELPLLAVLHDRIWAPIAGDIRTQAVLIAPHKVLHRLPFAALWTGKQYLVEQLALTILPSASVLPALSNPPRSKAVPLVVGTSGSRGNARLVHAATEARHVAEIYQGTPLLGEEATEAAVRLGLKQATVVHFAAHAGLNPDNAYASALSLVPSNGDDGNLQLAEILEIQLAGHPIVVMSACESLSGDIRTGDELAALQRGFLASGASAVVASLWVVDDRASTELMMRFHDALAEGASVSSALTKAQLALLRDTPWKHPFYWASMIATASN